MEAGCGACEEKLFDQVQNEQEAGWPDRCAKCDWRG